MTLKEFKKIMGCVVVDSIEVEGNMPNGMKFSFKFEEKDVGKSVGFFFRFNDDTCNDFEVRCFEIFGNNETSWMIIRLKDKDIPLE